MVFYALCKIFFLKKVGEILLFCSSYENDDVFQGVDLHFK